MRVVCCSLVLGLVFGCGQPLPQPTPVPSNEPVHGDALFVRGAFRAAVQAYDREIAKLTDPEAVAKTRFFRAVARIAIGNLAAKELARRELWQLEHEYASSVWGMLARLYLGEVSRGRVLRQTILHAGAELHHAQERIAELEGDLAQLGEQNAELQQTLTAMKEERARLQWQVKEAQEKSAAQEARVRELEEELAALKRIDMQRQP